MTALIICSSQVKILVDSFSFNDNHDTFSKEVEHILFGMPDDMLDIICEMLESINPEILDAFNKEYDRLYNNYIEVCEYGDSLFL